MTGSRSAIGLVLVLASACGPWSSTARAQPSAASAVTLTLDEALQRAVAVSHRLDDARARSDAAAAAVDQRRTAARPQVAAVGGYTRTNHVDEFGIPLPNNQLRIIYPDIPDNYRTRLDVQWPVYTSGRIGALEDAARREQTATLHDADTTTADVRLEVTRSFWGLVVARESEGVVAGSLTRLGEHVRDVRNRFDAGLVPPNEVLTAQAREARQRMLLVQARASREIAEAELSRLIGLAPGTPVVPAAALQLPSVDGPIETLVAEAREHRPERQALAARIAASEARQSAASAGRRPVVALAGGVDYARPNPRIFPRVADWRESWDAGVTVNWPLFDGGRAAAEVAEAGATARALRARLAELDSVIELDIRQRLSELASGQAAVEAADAAIAAATEARRVVGERFAAGVATSTEVVDAQMEILQAQLDRTQAIASARMAEARLDRARGR